MALGRWDEGNQSEISHSDLNEDHKTPRPQVACCDTMTGYLKDVYEIYVPLPLTGTTEDHSQ